MSRPVTVTFPDVTAAEKAEMAVLRMYNRAGDPELRAEVIAIANMIRLAINADENDDLI